MKNLLMFGLPFEFLLILVTTQVLNGLYYNVMWSISAAYAIMLAFYFKGPDIVKAIIPAILLSILILTSRNLFVLELVEIMTAAICCSCIVLTRLAARTKRI